MKLMPPFYYLKISIADNINDIRINELSLIDNKKANSYAIFKNEHGEIRKIIKYGDDVQNDYIYEYSNKGNLISFTFTNKKLFRVKEIYDYTSFKKSLSKRKYYKDGKYVKMEEYKNNSLVFITYYIDNLKYCTEFFNKNKHPYKVEYYNHAGLKI